MKNANTLFARGFSLRAVLLVCSLLALLFSSFAPVLTAYAVPNTTQNPPVTTQPTSPGTPTSPAPTNSTNTTITPSQSDSGEVCNNSAGPLSFFMCPMFEQIMKTINWLAGPQDSVLTSMLRVEPLQFNKDQGLQRAYTNILNFVNGLFILVFIVIIFANFISDFSFLEGYNVRSTLPRLIAAIILAQFGFLLCAIAIDIGNILGTAAPATISHGVLGANVPMPGLSDSVVGLLSFGNPSTVGGGTAAVTTALFGGGGGVVFLLMLIMSILVLFSLLLAFIYMVARNLILIILIFAAPLAFLAWVLPGTQPFFYKWGKNLIRLVLMFPLVTILITTAEVVSFMLLHPTFDPNVFTDDRFKLLIGGLMPFVALMMIPKCLKLSGEIMEFTGGAVAGYVAGKGRQHAKEAPSNTRDKMAESEFGKNNRFGRAIAGGGLTAIAMPNSGKVTRKLGERRSRAASAYEKAGVVGTDKEVKAMLRSRNTVERQAAIKALAKRGNREALQDAFDAKQIKPIDMAALKTTDFKEFGGMPDMRSYELGADGSYSFDDNKFFSGITGSTMIDAGPASQKSWFMNSSKDASGKWEYSGYNTANIKKVESAQLQNILRNPKVQGKMAEEVRKSLADYANAAGAGDAHAQAIFNSMNTNGTWK